MSAPTLDELASLSSELFKQVGDWEAVLTESPASKEEWEACIATKDAAHRLNNAAGWLSQHIERYGPRP